MSKSNYPNIYTSPLLSPKACNPILSHTPNLTREKQTPKKSFDFSDNSSMLHKSMTTSRSYQAINSNFHTGIKELSTEINDIYEFRSRCFNKIKNLEDVIERNKQTHTHEVNYMQEYINLLKRKLGKAKVPSQDSSIIERDCETCKEKNRINSNLLQEVDELKDLLNNSEEQNRQMSHDLQNKKQELNKLVKKLKERENTEELLEAIMNLEEKKVNYERKIQELQAENKKAYELHIENQKLHFIIKDKESLIKSLRDNLKNKENSENLKSFLQNIEKNVEEAIKNGESGFYEVIDKANILDKEAFRLSKISKFLM